MKRIIYFPPTYPDEDYRSIVHRYYLRSTKTFELSKIELLGKAKSGPIVNPENLTRVSIDLELTDEFVNHIIESHSYFPMIRPFLVKEQQISITEGMRGNSSRNEFESKSMHSFISPVGRYCPDCMITDYDRYGTTYLHRLHQLSFLNHCLLHGEALISSCNRCEEPLIRKDGREIPYNRCCTYCNQDVTENRFSNKRPTDQALLDDLNTLLNEATLDIEFVYVKFMIHIGARNFIHFRGDYIYKKKLMQQFIDFYGEKYLNELGIFTKNLTNQRKTKLFNKKYMAKHIILYILLMRFLSGSIKSFFKNHENYSTRVPFGNGPWLCLNPNCTYYNEHVIRTVKRKDHQWFTGRFTCMYCGMIYTRKSNPKEKETAAYSIETWGPIFRKKVIEYYEMGMSLKQISEKMYSNTVTISKYLRPHLGRRRKHRYYGGIEDEKVLEVGFTQAVAASVDDKTTMYKEAILDTIKTMGENASRSQISNNNQHIYSWLMKRERKWMEQRLPCIKQSFKYINRETLDDEIYLELKKAIAEAYKKNPREQIGGQVILREIKNPKRYLYYRHRSILPRSRELFESNLETADAYVLRRFDHILEYIKNSPYKFPGINTVGRMFPVVKKCSKELKEWIIDEIKNQKE